MEKAEEKPAPETSMCEVTGPEFTGLDKTLKTATPTSHKTTRLVIVHGIGPQLPGHSERLQRNLIRSLGLDSIDPTVKTIAQKAPRDAKTTAPDVDLGSLRISRYANAQGAELLTFELTYASLLDDERKAIAFDEYGISAKARADLNISLKGLINSFTDPLAYGGTKGDAIRGSMLQALCWVGRGEWADYPTAAHEACAWQDTKRNVIHDDDIMISTHSLGSKVALDSLATLGTFRDSLGKDPKTRA